jgi:hypothetical protein
MADITLDDIMKAPTDESQLMDHLVSNGYVQPAPPPVQTPLIQPAEVGAMTPPTPRSDVTTMTPPSIEGTMPKPLTVPRSSVLSGYTGPVTGNAAKIATNITNPVNAPASLAPIGGEAPEIAGTPAAAPSFAPLPALRKPTDKESIAAGIAEHGGTEKEEGRRQYLENRPDVTALPGTKEYDEQKLAQNAYDAKHPWGADISAHPGRFGKLGHVLGEIGQIGAMAVMPGLVANLPGNMFSRELENRGLGADLAQKTEQEGANQERQMRIKEAQAKLDKEGNEQSLITDPEGNVTGWKSGEGKIHSLDEEATPQAIKDVAEATTAKMAKPSIEKMENGDVVAVTTDPKTGKTSSEVVYHGDPKLDTDLTQKTVGGQEHKILINKKTGEMIKDLGAFKTEVSPTAALAKEKAGERVVLAYDKNNKAHLMSRADAEDEGMTHVTAAQPGDIDKAKTHHVVLNTLQTQLNSVVNTSDALDQNVFQRGIIANALSHPGNTTLDSLLRAGVMSGASEKTQNYVQAVLALREAGLALPKEITGGSRVAEIQASALWQTMPSAASLNSKYALKQATKFQQDIDRLRARAPEVRGMDIVDPDEKIASKGTEKQHAIGGGAAAAPAPAPPPGKVAVTDPQGKPHFVNENAVDDFLKDPKYKGWKRNRGG